MNIELRTEQKLALSAKMIQSAEILQMTAQDLSDYLQEAALENPVIDLSMPSVSAALEPGAVPSSEGFYQQSTVPYSAEEFPDDEDSSDDWKYKDIKEESLRDYLWAQLLTAGLEASDLEMLQEMLYCLDDRGYFEESLEHMAEHFSSSTEKIEELLVRLQRLDPAGVGARSLQECLMLQVTRLQLSHPILDALITFHLDEIAKNQLPKLCTTLGCTMEELLFHIQTIKGLNPKPGMAYCDRRQLSYLTPDVTVVKFQNRYDIVLNESRYPEIHINDYYAHLARQTDDPDVLQYLSEKIKHAQWLSGCMVQRGQTLLSITQAIVTVQKDFFAHGKSHLKPLRLIDVAQMIDVHESTVSRGVRGKYLQCMWGIFPLNYFFPKGIFLSETVAAEDTPQDGGSHLDVKQALKELVASENKKKPYSDRILAELLEAQGYQISRRTVAKYRDLLGIGDTTGRKEYG